MIPGAGATRLLINGYDTSGYQAFRRFGAPILADDDLINGCR